MWLRGSKCIDLCGAATYRMCFIAPGRSARLFLAWLMLRGIRFFSFRHTDHRLRSSTSAPPGNPVGANLTQVSSDPYTVAPGQHATEVEPHMFANGSTLVATFQTGRIAPAARPISDGRLRPTAAQPGATVSCPD